MPNQLRIHFNACAVGTPLFPSPDGQDDLAYIFSALKYSMRVFGLYNRENLVNSRLYKSFFNFREHVFDKLGKNLCLNLLVFLNAESSLLPHITDIDILMSISVFCPGQRRDHYPPCAMRQIRQTFAHHFAAEAVDRDVCTMAVFQLSF